MGAFRLKSVPAPTWKTFSTGGDFLRCMHSANRGALTLLLEERRVTRSVMHDSRDWLDDGYLWQNDVPLVVRAHHVRVHHAGRLCDRGDGNAVARVGPQESVATFPLPEPCLRLPQRRTVLGTLLLFQPGRKVCLGRSAGDRASGVCRTAREPGVG